MTRGCNTFIVLIIWQYSAENVLRRTILMKDALLLTFMKSKKWERCIAWISKWTRSNLRKEKIMPIIVVLLKKSLLIKLLEIQSGSLKEEMKWLKSKKLNKPRCLKCRKSKKSFWHRLMLIFQTFQLIQAHFLQWELLYSKECMEVWRLRNLLTLLPISKKFFFKSHNSNICSKQC